MSNVELADASTIFSFVDLTDLAETADETSLRTLCQRASMPSQSVAAVCVWPHYVRQARILLADTTIQVATVCNFPHGKSPLVDVIAEIQQAIAAGAQEVDVVFPREFFFAGKIKETKDFLCAVRAACGSYVLKIILESGAFVDGESLMQASECALSAGADFLKTSTGKFGIGATVPAAKILLSAIQKYQPQAGMKVSGGIRTFVEAKTYLALATTMMGEAWVTPMHFRIGASQLRSIDH